MLFCQMIMHVLTNFTRSIVILRMAHFRGKLTLGLCGQYLSFIGVLIFIGRFSLNLPILRFYSTSNKSCNCSTRQLQRKSGGPGH